MRQPRSLQGRLALWLGIALTLVWIAAASMTALIARHELDEVFDAALQEMAQRILPLAVIDILGREEEGISQRLAAIRDHDELFTYVIRDEQDLVLLQSHAADPAIFAPWNGTSFSQSQTHRFYNDDAVQGTIRITVAEPLAHRDAVAREIQVGLGLPLLFVVPVALLVIFLAVRTNLAPLRRYRDKLAAIGARDLTQVATDGLPTEMVPVADTLNGLLSRLSDAFEAERSFAANAAHELRTPLAGAIAQAQRLQAETDDPDARTRAAEIEATLKRLTRLSERLMQLARAEGGRLRRDRVADLRPVARIVVDDLLRAAGGGRIALTLADEPVLSDLDPDIFAILLRNLVENALRHGAAGTVADVSLTDDGVLIVANDGPVIPQDILDRLKNRFERAAARGNGSGLGLAIVTAIAERTGCRLDLRSPRSGQPGGFEARFTLPGP
ncbi:ATP-binding protein [Paracoccus actinidiae]|uniref:ATP-binding protein n=1 Tax=Paracoccus actinidiae TaxID=3064531 RepID=UPI0027D27BF6|nr:ATP-binding protein [Paracoccus sp. M09]